MERELIVIELFPMRSAVPTTMQDVVQRMVQLQYTSRLTLDARFFDRIARVVDLVDRVDAALPESSDIRDDPTYRRVRAYRRVDHLNVVTSSLPPELSNAGDFSRPRSKRASRRATTTRSRRASATRPRRSSGSGSPARQRRPPRGRPSVVMLD